MDLEAWLGLFGGGSLLLSVGIAIGLSKNRGKDIDALGQTVHKITNRLSVFPPNPDEVYARKETITAELSAIRESMHQIQGDVRALRNGGVGT